MAVSIPDVISKMQPLRPRTVRSGQQSLRRKKDFLAIAVVGDREEPLTPCGVCRQVLTEFVDGSTFEVIMEDGAGGIKVMKLEELFPASFSPKDLQS